MKKFLLVLAALGLMAQFSACTANKAQEDTEFVENADVDKIEAEEPALDTGTSQASTEQAAPAETENLALDNSLEAALAEPEPQQTATENTAPATPPAEGDLSLDTPPTEVAAAPTEQQPPTEQPIDPPAQEIAATPTDAAPIEAAPIEATPITETKPAPTASLKKVSDAAPYAFGDGFVNTVYIARPKETLKQISQTIYGSDKTKDLKKINSFLKARPPRAGDKIAYVSPNRPTDSSKTITYYEDAGMIPETYVAQKGDNLRKVAKNLLGYDNAWKEVWSTNPIESKSKLAEGETFKYWKAATTTAETSMPKSAEEAVNNIVNNNTQPQAEMAPPQPAMNELPPPPAQPELPPPPADAMAANTAPPSEEAALPPPPPDDSQFASPPPPAPSKAPAMEDGEEEETAQSEDMLPLLGLGAVLCAALAFALVKRKKAKAAEMSMNEGLGT